MDESKLGKRPPYHVLRESEKPKVVKEVVLSEKEMSLAEIEAEIKALDKKGIEGGYVDQGVVEELHRKWKRIKDFQG